MRTTAESRTARQGGVAVRAVSEEEFWSFLGTSPYASFQQTPQWGRARGADWDSELVGWFDSNDRLLGVTAVRHRRLPRLPWTFAYISFGPVIDWERGDVPALLAARMVPPLCLHHWDPDTVKTAIQDDRLASLSQVVPDGTDEVGLSPPGEN